MSITGSPALSLLLVGFQDQDNLGLRYLKSAVQHAGYTAQITTYRSDPAALLDVVQRARPAVIGFSLIFQYMAPDFGRVIQALREAGISAHFTMGGHYPSFDYGEILRRIPGLDSVVRFEGELTLRELLEKLSTGEDWRSIAGIAFRRAGEIVANPLRAPVADLDELPAPDRADIDYLSHELPTASVLASRGCPWDCSFCSIRPFYEAQGGQLRRLRRPEAIVAEMRALFEERHVPVVLFQDDDFLAGGKRAREWAINIANGLVQANLAGRMAFKISCRSDEIREDCMRELIKGGLTHVYMGVESGDDEALIDMSKRIKPEQHFRAGETLKRLGLSFDFGFMLLDPYSTLDRVKNNIDFLDSFVGDGWAVASFCRMLPYAGTPIKARLEAEGRLLGTTFEPDYRFRDPKLDVFYDWMLRTFHERNFTSRGLCHILKSLLFEARLRLPSYNRCSDTDRAYVKHLTAVCNGLAVYTLRTALAYIEATPLRVLEEAPDFLETLARHEQEEEARLLHQVVDYYWAIRRRSGSREGCESLEHSGGFDKGWTAADIG